MNNVDKVKVVLAVLLVAAGITAFYFLPQNLAMLRPVVVIVGLLAAAGVLWVSQPGQLFVDYARDSYREAQKVVWPNRKETWQITGIVFLFVAVLAVFMFAVDGGLGWILKLISNAVSGN